MALEVRAVLISALVFCISSALVARQSPSPALCPSLFVAVLSKPTNTQLRQSIRSMWHRAGNEWGDVSAKFVMCGDRQSASDELKAEADLHGDLVFIPCEEGYLHGILTKKVLAAMRFYLDQSDSQDLFMKTDDDTFVSTRRLCAIFQWRRAQGKSLTSLYAGVFAEGPNETITTNHTPDRDPSSAWYEPLDIFPDVNYPPSAKGGPGYILSKPVVDGIISKGIADRFVLHNEDKAVGVWVDKLIKNFNVGVDFVNLPGTDGYDEHSKSIVVQGTYKKYPHFLHHHISGPTIACLSALDATHSPELSVDGCFTDPGNTWFPSVTPSVS